MPLFTFHVHHHRTASQSEQGFRQALATLLNTLARKIDAMRAEVQQLVDNVAQLKTMQASSNAGWAAMVAQTGALKDQVAALQGQIAAGGVSADDLAAIVTATNDVHDVAVGMQQAVPQNVAPAPDAAQG